MVALDFMSLVLVDMAGVLYVLTWVHDHLLIPASTYDSTTIHFPFLYDFYGWLFRFLFV